MRSIFIKTLWPIILFCTALCAVALPVESTHAQSTLIHLSPAHAQVGEEQTTAVEVRVENVEALYGLDIRLSFDPSVVEVVDADPAAAGLQVRPGGLLSLDFVLRNTADNEQGTAWFALTQVNPSQEVSGSGVAFIVTFAGKSAGSNTPLSITYAKIVERTGAEIPASTENGTISVVPPGEAPATPTKAPTLPPPTLVTPTPTTPGDTPPTSTPTATPTKTPASPASTNTPGPTPTTAPGQPSPTRIPTVLGPTNTPGPTPTTAPGQPSPTWTPTASGPTGTPGPTLTTVPGQPSPTQMPNVTGPTTAPGQPSPTAASAGGIVPTPTAAPVADAGEGYAQPTPMSPSASAGASSEDADGIPNLLIVAVGIAGVLGIILLLIGIFGIIRMAKRQSLVTENSENCEEKYAQNASP